MAFFEFLVHGAAVSVFHGSEWCGPGSLEFLAGRSEALIYQDVLSISCVHGWGNSDNSAGTPAHTQLSVNRSKTSVTDSGSVRNRVFWHQWGHYLDLWLHVHTSNALYTKIKRREKSALNKQAIDLVQRAPHGLGVKMPTQSRVWVTKAVFLMLTCRSSQRQIR